MVDTVIVENDQAPTSAISWPAVFAGAAVSAALSLALLALGSGIGFASINPWASSPEPMTTKAAAVAGVYLTMTAIIASAVGGYLAGRLRHLWSGVHSDEAFFRDTAHGVVTWATATLASAAFLGAVGTVIAGGAVGGAASGAANRAASEAGVFTDRLLSYAPPAAATTTTTATGTVVPRDYAGDRSAAARMIGRLGPAGGAWTADDRQQLAAMVSARTGLPMPEAEKRVAAIETEARAAADIARRVAMQMSFWLAAAMMAGALAAALAAWEGGAIRDGRMRYATRAGDMRSVVR